jgi:hypothetical protein
MVSKGKPGKAAPKFGEEKAQPTRTSSVSKVSLIRFSMAIPSQEIRVSKRGGLRRLEYLLRLRHGEPEDPPLDVIFVSIDLERGIIDEQSTQAPLVKEVGIAKLDTVLDNWPLQY